MTDPIDYTGLTTRERIHAWNMLNDSVVLSASEMDSLAEMIEDSRRESWNEGFLVASNIVRESSGEAAKCEDCEGLDADEYDDGSILCPECATIRSEAEDVHEEDEAHSRKEEQEIERLRGER